MGIGDECGNHFQLRCMVTYSQSSHCLLEHRIILDKIRYFSMLWRGCFQLQVQMYHLDTSIPFMNYSMHIR